MFLDNCAADLLDTSFYVEHKMCILTTKLCMYDDFHKDGIYLDARRMSALVLKHL